MSWLCRTTPVAPRALLIFVLGVNMISCSASVFYSSKDQDRGNEENSKKNRGSSAASSRSDPQDQDNEERVVQPTPVVGFNLVLACDKPNITGASADIACLFRNRDVSSEKISNIEWKYQVDKPVTGSKIAIETAAAGSMVDATYRLSALNSEDLLQLIEQFRAVIVFRGLDIVATPDHGVLFQSLMAKLVAGPEATSLAVVIFATSQTFSGNLGGVSGADQKCSTAAQNPWLPFASKTYRALISSATANARTLIAENLGPVVNSRGERLADSVRDLWSQALTQPILYDETGTEIGGGVWTGTNRDGGISSPNMEIQFNLCKDWTSAAATDWSHSGNTAGTDTWIDNEPASCDQSLSIYCVGL